MRFPVNFGFQVRRLLFRECLIDLATSFGSGSEKRTTLRLQSCILSGNASPIQEHNLMSGECSLSSLFDFVDTR